MARCCWVPQLKKLVNCLGRIFFREPSPDGFSAPAHPLEFVAYWEGKGTANAKRKFHIFLNDNESIYLLKSHTDIKYLLYVK